MVFDGKGEKKGAKVKRKMGAYIVSGRVSLCSCRFKVSRDTWF